MSRDVAYPAWSAQVPPDTKHVHVHIYIYSQILNFPYENTKNIALKRQKNPFDFSFETFAFKGI